MSNWTSRVCRPEHCRWVSYEMGAIAAALALSGCSQAGDEASPSSQRQSARASAPVDGRVVVEWNAIAFENAVTVDGYGDLFPHLRALTMMHLAMHDAANGVRAKYGRYASDAKDGLADASAATAAAAHTVLSRLYPASQPALDQSLEPYLQGLGDAELQAAQQLGTAAAEAIVALRTADGSDGEEAYTPGTEPGDYQFVPPNDFIYRPAWRLVTPFGLDAVDQFRSEPPVALDSAAYAADFAEVKAYGRLAESTRTEDQTFYADWWYELSDIGWNRIARVVWEEQPLDLWETARAFALLNVSLMDGYLAGWDSKLFYDFWRPFTAIRAADTDGNDATQPEPGWDAYCATPPIQDYPSTHSVLGAAGAEVLAYVFGTDVGFSMESTSSKPPGQLRSLPTFEAAALENADSRVACGIHFRFATEAGLAMGRQIGRHAVSTLLPAASADRVKPTGR